MWYLISLSLFYIGTYFLLFFGIPVFFNHTRPHAQRHSFFSIIAIVGLYAAIVTTSLLITNTHPELGNRILHGVGGGMLVVLICFIALRDSRFGLHPAQFFIIGVFVATTLGVGNEIAEYVLQNHFGFISAESINDTWLDLVSNTIGAILTAFLLAPFVRLYKRTHNS